MSKDIATLYTRMQNERCGRKGYSGFKREKETVIKPKDYGIFKYTHRHHKNSSNIKPN